MLPEILLSKQSALSKMPASVEAFLRDIEKDVEKVKENGIRSATKEIESVEERKKLIMEDIEHIREKEERAKKERAKSPESIHLIDASIELIRKEKEEKIQELKLLKSELNCLKKESKWDELRVNKKYRYPLYEKALSCDVLDPKGKEWLKRMLENDQCYSNWLEESELLSQLASMVNAEAVAITLSPMPKSVELFLEKIKINEEIYIGFIKETIANLPEPNKDRVGNQMARGSIEKYRYYRYKEVLSPENHELDEEGKKWLATLVKNDEFYLNWLASQPAATASAVTEEPSIPAEELQKEQEQSTSQIATTANQIYSTNSSLKTRLRSNSAGSFFAPVKKEEPVNEAANDTRDNDVNNLSFLH